MRVEIVIERDRARRWLLDLAAVLETSLSCNVVFRLTDPKPPVSRALKTLLLYERSILRTGSAGMMRLGPEAALFRKRQDGPPDCTVDLTSGANTELTGIAVEVRFDGAAGEEALFSALMNRGTPRIEVVNRADGREAAHGTASLEAASGMSGAMEAVYSRVAVLIGKAIRDTGRASEPAQARMMTPVRIAQVLKRVVKQSVVSVVRSIYGACFFPSHWRVGWRFIEGDGVGEQQNLGGQPWQVLTGPHDHFYADPFPFKVNGKSYLFFEDLPQATQKGVISVVEMTPSGPVSEPQTVLEEPWHLSYPFVFARDGEIWMIPESSTNKEVVLYRAKDFPKKWERHTVLLSGVEAADATIAEYQGRLWMFAVVRNGTGGYSDILNIYHADTLTGPWIPHDRNPVLVDDRAARPAGQMFQADGVLWRPVQDCRNGYGAALALASIDELSPSVFRQTVHKTLTPGGVWPGRKLHTLNRAGQLEVIDGCTYQPRSRIAAKLLRLVVPAET